MRNLRLIGCLLMALLLITACSDDPKGDNGVKMSQVTVSYKLPEDVKAVSLSDVTVSFKNITTGKVTTAASSSADEYKITTTLPEGLYNIDLEGSLVYTIDTAASTKASSTDVQVKSQIRASQAGVQITGETVDVPALQTYLHSVKDGFVFAEIAIGGTLYPSGDTYNGDSYFRIMNNTTDTLYADGLVLFESEFGTDDKQDYQPNVMAQAFTAGTAYMIPGNGKDYPVAPGKSIIICDQAKDHTKINPNSFDLSKADFEWYDETDDPDGADQDNPAVPNMIPLLSTMGPGLWQPNQGGTRAYAIGYLGDGINRITAEQYLNSYKYHWVYKMEFDGNVFDMDGDAYMVPNTWIADAVNMYPQTGTPAWLVTDPSLDKGYASIASEESSDDHYGKCIRRKYDATGKKLVDTNNSSSDFLMMQKADPYYIFK